MWFDNLKEKQLWANFSSISAIPRESGNEEGVRKFLLKWAEEHNLRAVTDKIGNVVIYKEASEGCENKPSICLQGHMDMVCVKREESEHNFETDGIEIVCDGKTIRAKDTSLGADNGIAIAMAMTLLEDESLKHGPIEALFTISEETGLTGAFNLDPENIKSRYLLNLDSEEEGIIYTGCAGGIEIDARKKAKYKEVPKNWSEYVLTISGLLGGHSGGEIHKERANAIKLAARILHRLPDYMLTGLDGGTRRNVIPSSCTLSFCTDNEYADIIESIVEQVRQEVREEYRIQDPDISIELDKLETPSKEAIKAKTSIAFMESIYLAPCGVQAMSLAVPGVVETSNNVAIAKLEDGLLSCVSSTRSLVQSAKNETAYRVGAAFEDLGSKVIYSGDYPSWAPNPDSAFTKQVAAAYKTFTRKKPIVTCIHAGLECGIINSVIPGMDSLSIGPNLFDVHSVNEHVEVDSAERIMDFLRFLLASLK